MAFTFFKALFGEDFTDDHLLRNQEDVFKFLAKKPPPNIVGPLNGLLIMPVAKKVQKAFKTNAQTAVILQSNNNVLRHKELHGRYKPKKNDEARFVISSSRATGLAPCGWFLVGKTPEEQNMECVHRINQIVLDHIAYGGIW